MFSRFQPAHKSSSLAVNRQGIGFIVVKAARLHLSGYTGL